MLSSLPSYILYILAVTVSAVVSLYAVKKIIFIARKRKIYDIPDNIRKIHGEEIPSLGGIGVFIGYIATIPFFIQQVGTGWVIIITSTVLLFFTGIYDDLMNMRPSKKLIAQFIAAFITVKFADIRIPYLYGFNGVIELPYWVSIGVTTFCCTFFINVFNFIDGIDGLAGMLSILCCGVLGSFFAVSGNVNEACISFALLGATAGLLYYNYFPAKIYMGDTGSMLSGFTIFILSVFFIRYMWAGTVIIQPGPSFIVMLSILFYPVFDAVRVFILRAKNGISPLKADRRHLHYYLLDSGMSHAATAWLITGINALTILLAILFYSSYQFGLVLTIISIPSIVLAIVAAKLHHKSSNK